MRALFRRRVSTGMGLAILATAFVSITGIMSLFV